MRTVFPKVVNSTGFIAESIAKDICAQLSNDVLAIVPQTADYTCPICTFCGHEADHGSGEAVVRKLTRGQVFPSTGYPSGSHVITSFASAA